jgi:kynurenine formamidase
MDGIRTCAAGAAAILALVGCASAPRPAATIDLTHAYDERTIYWPKNTRFHWEKKSWGRTAAGSWYASADFTTSEHGGTHIDAPIHFAPDGATVDAIPVERLVGPADVIDVRADCARIADYAVTAHDLLAWEAAHGEMRRGDIVLIWTGWAARWPDPARYLGTATPDDAATLHFPGLAPDAAELLVARGVSGVGIDTASIDPGRALQFPVHRILSRGGVYALENVADLGRLPTRGAVVYALPMKIAGGSGGPTRVIARVP